MAQETTGKDSGKDAIKLTTRGKVAAGIGVVLAAAAILPPAARIVDRGLAVEEQGPIAPNPALVGTEKAPSSTNTGQITTESGQKGTVNMPEAPAAPNINQVPQTELPSAQNGPGLHST